MSEMKEMIFEIKKELKENKELIEGIDDFANARDIGTADKEVIFDVLSAVLFAISNTIDDYPEFEEFFMELNTDNLKKKFSEAKMLN